MNEFTILPDDPKLTAYALGELEGEERQQVEAWLNTHPAARAAIDEIRATALQLQAAFADEPLNAPIAVKPADPYARSRKTKWLQFPQIYYVVGSLAAACFAVVLAMRERDTSHRELRVTEFKLASPAPEAAAVPTPVALPLSLDAQLGAASASAPSTARPTDTAPSLAELPASAPDVQPTTADKQFNPAAMVGNETRPLFTFDAKIAGPGPIGSATPAEITAASLARAHAGVGSHMAAGSPPAVAKSYGSVAIFTGQRPKASGIFASSPEARDSLRRKLSAEPALASNGFGAFGGVSSGYINGASLAGSRAQTLATESYDYRRESDFLAAVDNPLSTFSIDVDTASYANVRRMLQHGTRPPADAVRVEEMLNYFPYSYAPPLAANGGAPFAASMEVASAPWAPSHRLVRIGLKGREVSPSQRGPANLVFLLDVSGSMSQSNKLPLVKESLRLLVARLRPDDQVAIVTYAGASGLALPSTPVSHSREIIEAIDDLAAGGSTNGAMGIQLAYDVAKAHFVAGGINRVVLCTDGDFNVGVTSTGELVRLITEKAKSGVFLTALGFGMGNYKDATLQQLADAGNGNYGYVDQRREAEKLLVEQVSGTLMTIAKDVKLQVEFNPAKVASYRLIGYEKRLLKKEDFNNDAVDAGEIGAGHTVTALYEIVPVGADRVEKGGPTAVPAADPLKYAVAGQNDPKPKRSGASATSHGGAGLTNAVTSEELLTLKLRYKEPDGDVSRKLEFPLVDRGTEFAQASGDFKFASAVAAFGMVLRESSYRGAATLADVMQWAEAAESPDPGGYRAEFITLVRQAKRLTSDR